MRFPTRDPLQALPGLQLRPKAPQYFRASPDRPADLSQLAAQLPPSPEAPQHPMAVFRQLLPLPLLPPVKLRPLPLAPPLQFPEILPPPLLNPLPVHALLRPLFHAWFEDSNARLTASGSFSITCRRVAAGPLTRRVPCSHFR